MVKSLAALCRGRDSVPSTHIKQFATTCNSSFKELEAPLLGSKNIAFAWSTYCQAHINLKKKKKPKGWGCSLFVEYLPRKYKVFGVGLRWEQAPGHFGCHKTLEVSQSQSCLKLASQSLPLQCT